LFSSNEEKYYHISKLHGAFWRYKFTDHHYLYNLHFPPLSFIKKYEVQLESLITQYPSSKRIIIKYLANWLKKPEEFLAVGNGASELIKIISLNFCQKGTIIVPTFNEYEAALPQTRINYVFIDSETLEIDLRHVYKEAINSDSNLIIIVNPNNPTSLVIEQNEIIQLLNSLKKNNKQCMVLLDESFIDFANGNYSLQDYIEQYSNLVILKSMSKVFGICGLRLGYIISSNIKFVQAVNNLSPIWNINGFSEFFLQEIENYRRIFLESCELVKRERDYLFEGLSKIDWLKTFKPNANYVCCKILSDFYNSEMLTKQLFVKYNILIKSCHKKNMKNADRYVRIASRTIEDNSIILKALKGLNV
jgi:histidinol-phosphate/aromatic aminotransferase/cobyric acid decarboxylase-like protein